MAQWVEAIYGEGNVKVHFTTPFLTKESCYWIWLQFLVIFQRSHHWSSWSARFLIPAMTSAWSPAIWISLLVSFSPLIFCLLPPQISFFFRSGSTVIIGRSGIYSLVEAIFGFYINWTAAVRWIWLHLFSHFPKITSFCSPTFLIRWSCQCKLFYFWLCRIWAFWQT